MTDENPINDTSLTSPVFLGWNTRNVHSRLSHVLLPQGLAINLLPRDPTSGAFLRDVRFEQRGDGAAAIVPGFRSGRGTYTELSLSRRGIKLRVQSATDRAEGGDQLILLVTTLIGGLKKPLMVVKTGYLWNRVGQVQCINGTMLSARDRSIHVICQIVQCTDVPALTAFLAISLEVPTIISACVYSAAKAKEIKKANRLRVLSDASRSGDSSEDSAATQGDLAWNRIYDPCSDRVISSESRISNKELKR